METEGQKPVISLIMFLLLHLLRIFKETAYLIYFYLHIVSFSRNAFGRRSAFLLFSDTSKPYWRFENKLFQRPLIYQIHLFSLHRTTKDFLAFIKATADLFVISIIIVPFKIDWFVFKGEQFDWFASIWVSFLWNIVNSWHWSIII